MNELSVPDAEITPPRNGAVALPAPSPTARPQIALALIKAQRQVRRVDHDQTVSFGQTTYDYTSSEAVIEASKNPLSEAGLALLPLEETLNGHEKEGANRFELECKFLLMHSSGESLVLLRHWPVVPGQGRGLDKATAAASTLCLAYLLRDLLLIPRVAAADEVAARDDRPVPPPAPRAAKKPKTVPDPETGEELVPWLDRCDRIGASAGRWMREALIEAVYAQMVKKGANKDMASWDHQTVLVALEECKVFGHAHQKPAAKAG